MLSSDVWFQKISILPIKGTFALDPHAPGISKSGDMSIFWNYAISDALVVINFCLIRAIFWSFTYLMA